MSFPVLTLLSTEAWKSLTDKVQEARSNARLKELSFDGEALFLTTWGKYKKKKKCYIIHIWTTFLTSVFLHSYIRRERTEDAGRRTRGGGLPVGAAVRLQTLSELPLPLPQTRGD